MSDERILRPGTNIWQVGRASRLAFLVDGEAYFGALARALARARRSVLVAAWEIDDHVDLDPAGHGRGDPTRLGDALRTRLHECRSLRVSVLAWDFAMLYAVERGLEPLFRLRFSQQRRLDFRLDSFHPLGASHHQKLVVVDDDVAFVGGFDVAPRRWDRTTHRADDPARRDPDGSPCRPFHDVQALVEGAPARALGELFRERWRCATGRHLQPPPPPGEGSETAWPSDVRADLDDVDVGIARTRAAHDGVSEVREVERLYLDAIGAARHFVYIENQYLTSTAVTRALAGRLAEPEGPDVVIVGPRRCDGWLEQRTVGLIRRRRLEELRGADKGGRLRIVYPRIPGVEDGVFVHAKVMVVDDVLARVGSANLSNRSMGFDSECDLAVESGGDERIARGIRGFRDRLLAEHLGCDTEMIEPSIQRSGSLAAALDTLSSRSERALVPLDAETEGEGWEAAVDLGEALADPESPEQPERLAETFLARDLPGAARTPWLRAAAGGALLGALWATASLTPLGDSLTVERVVEAVQSLRHSPFTPIGVIATYVGGSLLFFPITLLIVATAFVFPAAEAIAYALVGVLLASLAGFTLGHILGRDLVRRVGGGRLNRISRRLAQRGVLAVAVVRLVPVAPFTLVNVIAGASHVALRDFLLGTLAGVLPGVLAIVLLEASLEELVRRPGIGAFVGVVLVLGAAVLVFAVVRRVGPGSGR